MTDITIDERRLAEPLFYTSNTIELPLSPTQLDIHTIHVKTACELNLLWHSRFPKVDWSNIVRNKRYVCFVAEFKGVYFATALWSSPIAGHRLSNGDKMLELRRMAIADDAPKNTASRMIKQMRLWIQQNFTEIETLISYQDTESHFGTIYKASNWTAVNQSKEGQTWGDSRVRNQPQSTAAKVRWEYKIK